MLILNLRDATILGTAAPFSCFHCCYLQHAAGVGSLGWSDKSFSKDSRQLEFLKQNKQLNVIFPGSGAGTNGFTTFNSNRRLEDAAPSPSSTPSYWSYWSSSITSSTTLTSTWLTLVLQKILTYQCDKKRSFSVVKSYLYVSLGAIASFVYICLRIKWCTRRCSTKSNIILKSNCKNPPKSVIWGSYLGSKKGAWWTTSGSDRKFSKLFHFIYL